MSFDSIDHQKCEECGAIYKELIEAWRAARMRFREHWLASGKDHQDFKDVVRSMRMEFLEDENLRNELLQANAPDVARAQRRMAEHEAATGHSVLREGSRNIGFRDLSELF
jgi:hypothetical protein